MKRFKNILALYDLGVGADETLERALILARQNKAKLTVLHVVNPKEESRVLMSERRKLMTRIFSGTEFNSNNINFLVKFGEPIREIMDCVSAFDIDLIVAPTQEGLGFEKLIGTDLNAELMRVTSCPVWVVRPGGHSYYRKIVAAVNAGKETALECPKNRRILEIGASLAEREGAILDVLYIWDYSGVDAERLSSELHTDTKRELFQTYRYDALQKVVGLTCHYLGEPLKANPTVLQGDVEDGILEYVRDNGADLLVTEGSPGNPLVNAIVGNRSLRILNQANCSVLLTRPVHELETWSAKMREGESLSALSGKEKYQG